MDLFIEGLQVITRLDVFIALFVGAVGGVIIGAIPERENPFDVLISRDKKTLDSYKPGAKVGTSSLRRASSVRISPSAAASLRSFTICGGVEPASTETETSAGDSAEDPAEDVTEDTAE